MRTARLAASALLVALILLGLAWELAWAPLKPGGSWLVLKIVPLMAILRLIVFYAAEGVTRAYTDGGLSARLALVESALAFAYFGAAVSFVRATRAAAR